jgi:aspartyl-tRNA(Asn)/glutamyl-tRNA(Gln) amidotransferase subunit B
MSKDKFDYFIKGEKNNYEVIIGLEVHAQVSSNSKLFSGSATKFGAEPNSQVSLIDSAFPGMLPVINKECINQAIRTGLGLNAKINNNSVFDRKNYFYADLPQGYQISQYKNPIVGEGKVLLDMPYGSKEIGIERLHLEQDAGKSIHDMDPSSTYVDLNRSGIALMEIVSKPDLRSPEEVNAYIKKLRTIMRYLGTCDGNMQEGSLRADVNVSVRQVGDKNFGIEYEAKRQVELLDEGKKIEQETRLFDTKKNETRSMRSKEDAHDYRYFPDPDLLPLKIEQKLIDDLKKTLPELPDNKKERFMSDYGLNSYEANVLVSEKEISNYYEEVAKLSDKKLAATWMMGDLFAMLNDKGLNISKSPISAKNFAELIQSIKSGEISGRIAKEVFELMVESGDNPKKIIESKGMKQQSDPKELEKIINEILTKNKDKVDQYKSGKEKLFGFFVGQVMKQSGGKANPQLTNDILKKLLKG